MTFNLRSEFDLKNCIPMGRAEETRCASEYLRTKAPLLAEQMITANMRLVVKIAKDYRRGNQDMRDLIQEGNLGLMQAVARFDPDRGVKLCSYAAWWIRAYILKYVIDNWRLVKTGTTQAQRKLFFSLHKQQQRLRQSGVEADAKQLADAMGVKEKDVVSMIERFSAGETSLDWAQQSSESGNRPPGDWLGASPALQPDVLVETSEFIRKVRTRVDTFAETLHGRDLVIFQQRFLNEDPPTLTHLAVGFGVSRERARQLEERLKIQLRGYLRQELGDAVPGTDPRRRSTATGPTSYDLEERAAPAAAA
ncbi:MAG TPA: sigma-70 family RNA polymerase sigma factor [Polyangia bacterium]|nr:sigma-70 family RNA polymerase sigma factor [Polyangia bacterium]